MMRLTTIFVPALMLALSSNAVAQEWDEFFSKEERFSVNFPGTPSVTETTWTSQFGAILPARVYTGASGPGKFSITVVDYNPIQRLLSER